MNHRQESVSDLKEISQSTGRFFHLMGCLLFAFSSWLLADNPENALRIGSVFQVSGFFLTSSWLLLRFAGGLFPFSRKVFR